MKSISTTVFCLLMAGATFGQRNASVTNKGNTSNISVSNNSYSTHSTTNVQASSSNYSVGNSHSSTNDYGNNNSNNNSYNSNSYSSNNYSNNNSNSNSNSTWPIYNNSNSNSNNYNNSYNSYNGNSGYNSYNNSNYNTYETKQSYIARDENYGQQTISEDQGTISKSNPYNTAKMLSNYRNNTPIQKFFKNNQKPSQIFIINAQQENTVKATGGTIIKIAPNSFVDQNGQVVKGDVEFEVKEMYSKSDMILSNAHTVCNDQVLKSGGEVFLGAEKNGEPLILANNKPISVEFPATSKEPMQLFNGQPNGNTVNWNLASTNELTPVANTNSQTGFSYNFSSSNMNWLNCDQFVNRGTGGNSNNNTFFAPTTKVNVHLSDRFDSTNTAVFLVYKGQNTVTKFDGFSRYDGSTRMAPDQNTFDTKWYSVQEGAQVTIVAISEINGQYYSTMDETTIQKDHTEYLSLQPTTLDQIKIDMENLR